jgi:D-threo-aldose 1-dehydrogenase
MNRKISLPRVIAGTSLLGNLYEEYPFDQKKEIVKAYIEANSGTPVFDSAGKYGAGLALETLGQCLRELAIQPEDVIISNKLAWLRAPLTTDEPVFEVGVWKNLQYDAKQKISYKGIIECFEQGNELLGTYIPQMVSVHDPDEYLAAAVDRADEQRRYHDILEAYRALHDLKAQGQVQHIGIGAKTWTTIERIYNDVQLDWVMLANSLTVYHHPPELLNFVERLHRDCVTVINSAVFHGGFLIGSNYFNYQPISKDDPEHQALLQWREKYNAVCSEFQIKPAEACVYFALNIPGITSVALNSSSPQRTKQNVTLAQAIIPKAFWAKMKEEGLIDKDYPFV